MYHLSGARVINCESSLPQENYIDYDIADLTGKRSKLSDEQILFKLFIELAFESIQRRMIPIELLDLLSFNDVLKIRQPILESNFQAKYDNLIQRVIKGIKQDYSETFFDLNELENIRKHLETTFIDIFEKELPNFIRKKKKEELKKLSSVGSSVALGALGFVPEVSAVASGISVLKDSPALIFNIRQFHSSDKSITDLERYLKIKEDIVKRQIDKTHISDQSTMLDMVELLSSTLSEKIRI